MKAKSDANNSSSKKTNTKKAKTVETKKKASEGIPIKKAKSKPVESHKKVPCRKVEVNKGKKPSTEYNDKGKKIWNPFGKANNLPLCSEVNNGSNSYVDLHLENFVINLSEETKNLYQKYNVWVSLKTSKGKQYYLTNLQREKLSKIIPQKIDPKELPVVTIVTPYAESVDEYFSNSKYLFNDAFINFSKKKNPSFFFNSTKNITVFDWKLFYYENSLLDVTLSVNQKAILNIPNIIQSYKLNNQFTRNVISGFNRGTRVFPWPNFNIDKMTKYLNLPKLNKSLQNDLVSLPRGFMEQTMMNPDKKFTFSYYEDKSANKKTK